MPRGENLADPVRLLVGGPWNVEFFQTDSMRKHVVARGARLAAAALVAAAAWPAVGAAQTFTHTVFEIAVDNEKVTEHPAVRFENDPRPVKVGMEIPRGLALRIDKPGVVVRIRNTDDDGPAGPFERISLDCNQRS